MIPDMAVHEIRIPDMVRGDEPRSILWDDVAGTVSGDHFRIAYLEDVLAAPKPVTVGGPPSTIWDLVDPGHRPEEFLVLLFTVWHRVLDPEHRDTLPEIFDGVAFPEGEPGEELYDDQGNLMT